mmetsp:Transcript_12894/g.40517  ORF Transcript_12894/g.40517 Transcript_12894/m.40517 type:complete len:119 (+) Transcript_12894:84-440(+)
MFGAIRATAMRPLAAAIAGRGLGCRLAPQVRNATGIKLLEEKGRAAEGLYWHQEDERLLKKLIENHPELDPKYQGISNILSDESTLEGKVKLIFMKHGLPPAAKELVADILALAEQKA